VRSSIYFIIIFFLQGLAIQPEQAESYANSPDEKHLHEIPPYLQEIDPGGAKNRETEPRAGPYWGVGDPFPGYPSGSPSAVSPVSHQ
jgi:hypothetical protein